MVMFGDVVMAELPVCSTSFDPLLQTSVRDKVSEMERMQHLNANLGIKDPIYNACTSNNGFQA